MNWTAIIVAVIALVGSVTNSVFLYKAQKNRKKDLEDSKSKPNPQSPNALPSFLCYARGEQLTKLEIKVQKCCDDIRELKEEIRDLKSKKR